MLYEHQKLILSALEKGARCLIAPPRTGKTRPVIAFLAETEKVLVLTKKAAISGWHSELDALKVKGWTVTNHEKLRTKGWDMGKEWGALVLDECHVFGGYPKPSQIVKPAWDLRVSGPRIGISATPCSESYSQLYHQAKALRLPIWQDFKKFYAWHRHYGIPDTIRAHGRTLETYKRVRPEVWEDFAALSCIVDRSEAVPDFVEAEDHVEVIDAPGVLEMCEKLRRDGVIYVDGRAILAETPLALAQKCQQICAGVVLDEAGFPVVVNSVKRDWIAKRFTGSKTAILTQFRAEVDPLVGGGSSVGSVAEFQANLVDWVVGNVASLNAGVDLSRADALVLTGCPWSYTQFAQARERLLRRDRDRVAPVYFPVIRGGIDELIYDRVARGKGDFHARMYGAKNPRAHH